MRYAHLPLVFILGACDSEPPKSAKPEETKARASDASPGEVEDADNKAKRESATAKEDPSMAGTSFAGKPAKDVPVEGEEEDPPPEFDDEDKDEDEDPDGD